MKRNFSKKTLFAIPISLVVILTFTFLAVNRATKSNAAEPDYIIYNDDGTVTLPLNATGYGIRNSETGAIINTGDIIYPEQGKINVVMSIEQNMPEAKEYALIVLVDNEQRAYKIDGEMFKTYLFDLEARGEVFLDIEVEARESDKEIIFTLFQQPSFTGSDDDLYAAFDFIKAFSCRFMLYADTNERYILNDNNFIETVPIEYSSNAIALYVTDNIEEHKMLTFTESGEKNYVVFTNRRDYEIVYAFGLFLGWEQYAFDDGEMIKYIQMPPQSSKVYEFTAPEVDKKNPLQAFVVPHGFLTRDDVLLRQGDLNLVAGIRTIIVP